MIIVDAHQDLAYNILSFGRDYTRPAAHTRQSEAGSEVPLRNGNTLLGWPEYQRGRVALIFSTLFAAPQAERLGNWETQYYTDINQAHRIYRGQLDAYHRLEDQHPDKFRLVRSQAGMRSLLAGWQGEPDQPEPPAGQPPPESEDGPGRYRKLGKYYAEEEAERAASENLASGRAVGLVPLMEGAEGIRSPGEVEEWWQRGLRLIGLAWAGTRFCGGTRQPGPLTAEGFALLEVMADLGFGLDISHMDEKAVLQALDVYPGTVFASHANAHALLKGLESNRHLSDQVIQRLLERDGVIGVVPYNRFLLPGWTPADGRHLVTLEHVVAHIDYICQMAGDARHVGIGTDFDGGFGLESAPAGIDTIADLRKLIPLLAERGYAQEDIAAIMGMNWINVLERTLPEAE
jgi:membrane dipeptidase